MTREQFEHAIRAAGAVLGVTELLVIGSQAVHGSMCVAVWSWPTFSHHDSTLCRHSTRVSALSRSGGSHRYRRVERSCQPTPVECRA